MAASSSTTPSLSVQFRRRGIVDFTDPSRSPSPVASASEGPAQPSTPSPHAPRKCSRSCSLRANISTDTTFLKVEAPVHLLNSEAKESLTRSQRTKRTFTSLRSPIRLGVALHIHHKHITSLAFSRQSSLPDRLVPVYRRFAEKDTISLHLTLSTPPTLVVPNLPGHLMPHTREDLAVLTAFQLIAGATTTAATTTASAPFALTLTLYIPGASLTDVQASSLCASLTSSEALVEQPKQLDTLFGGLGARAIPLHEVAAIVDPASPTASPSSRNTQSPPGYDDSEPGERLPAYKANNEEEAAAGHTRGRKRPRLEEDSCPAGGASEKAMRPVDDADATPTQTLQQQLAAAHSAIARLETLTAASAAKEAALNARLAAADAKLLELAEATANYEYAASEVQDVYIDERMEELREELVQHLDERLEESGLDVLLRHEVEEVVEAQVGAAMEDLRARLADGVRVILPED